MRRTLLMTALTLWFGLGAASVAARQPQTSLADTLDLARLVDLAAQRAGVAVEYDPARLQGRITLRGQQSLTDADLWSVMNRSLAGRGLTTVRLVGDPTLSVLPITEAAAAARVEPMADLWATPAMGRAGFATVVLDIRHADPARLVDAVRPYLSRQGSAITRIGETRSLIISDLSTRLAQVHELITRLDVPPPQAAIRNYRPAHRDPAQLAEHATAMRDRLAALGLASPRGDIIAGPGDGTLVLLCADQDEGLWRSLLTDLDRAGDATTVDYSPGAFSLPEVASLIDSILGSGNGEPGTGAAPAALSDWSLVQDPLTNSLIITGRPQHHARVTALLERLSATPASERRIAQLFPIRHRAVGEVIDVLQSLLAVDAGRAGLRAPALDPGSLASHRGLAASHPSATTPLAPGSDGDALSSATPPAAPDADLRQPPIILTSDESTNTLIALGEPRIIAQIHDLLRTIDVRQPQVMLEVVLVSLSDAQTRNLGVEMAGLIKSGELRVRLASLFGLSGIAGGLPGGGVGGAGGTATVLAPEDFALVVRALETVNQGRSLSRPRILIGNGQQASLNSTLGQPITSVNASDTVATTSFAGFSDAGTQVSITPRITAGEHLLLEYSITLSAFVGESPGAGVPPPRQQNQLQSVVSIPDGYTVVVGGIELITEGQSESRVPLLGSIPIIREAFRTRAWNDNRQRFFVFIRAEIDRGRSFDALRYASDEALDQAGVEGWPTVEPRVVR